MEGEQIEKYNVLGITGVWTGAFSFFFEGKEISKGMPAFNNVFLRLLDDSRVDVLILFLLIKKEQIDKINIPIKYRNKLIIRPFIFDRTGKVASLLVFLKIIFKGVLIVKRENVRRIVGFGPPAGLTAIIGNLTGIPDFRRLYGTFLINEISKSKLLLFLKHPLEILCFMLKGKALLITNDGTKGDLVFRKLGNRALKLYFPLNGVDPAIEQNMIKPYIDLPSQYISYVARIDNWKRQHLLVGALGLLKREKMVIPKTFIIGAFVERNYLDKLKRLIIEYDLDNEVQLVNGLTIQEVHYVLKNSVLTYSLYHTSNLGNVFLESMKLGTPTIAINDTGSLDLIPKEAFFELKDDSIENIALATRKLLYNTSEREKLSKGAKNFARVFLDSWEKRARYEIDLMLD